MYNAIDHTTTNTKDTITTVIELIMEKLPADFQ